MRRLSQKHILVFWNRPLFTDLEKTHFVLRKKNTLCVSCDFEKRMKCIINAIMFFDAFFLRFKTLKCVFDSCISRFYSVQTDGHVLPEIWIIFSLLVKSRQTTDNRQKVMHKSSAWNICLMNLGDLHSKVSFWGQSNSLHKLGSDVKWAAFLPCR